MGCGASSSPGPRVHPEVRAPTDGEGKKLDPMDARVPKKNPCGGSASSVGRVAESDDSRGKSSDGGDSCTVQGDLALAADAQRKDRERRQKTTNGGDGGGGGNSAKSTNAAGVVSPVALFRAAKKGDIGGLHEALASGVNVNARGMWENTALICACQYAMTEAALLLIGTLGCDVNATNEKGCTALHHAAIEGQIKIVSTLIGAGALPLIPEAKLYNENIDKNELLDPLQAAFASGSGVVAATIMDAVLKCDTDDYRNSAIRCIQITLERGLEGVLEHALRLGRLLSDGALVSTILSSCKTETTAASILAFAKENPDSSTLNIGMAVIMLAARNGWLSVLGDAIDMGVLLNNSSTEGQEETGQLLVLAVQSGVLASVKLLLEGGCTEGRAAALDAAQKLAKHEMVDVLLKYQSCLVPDLSDPREGSDQGVGKGGAVSGDATPRDAYPIDVS